MDALGRRVRPLPTTADVQVSILQFPLKPNILSQGMYNLEYDACTIETTFLYACTLIDLPLSNKGRQSLYTDLSISQDLGELPYLSIVLIYLTSVLIPSPIHSRA